MVQEKTHRISIYYEDGVSHITVAMTDEQLRIYKEQLEIIGTKREAYLAMKAQMEESQKEKFRG